MKDKIHALNEKLRYFVIDESKDFSYKDTVKNLKAALSWELRNPDYMASLQEMEDLEHDMRIIQAL